ncbi:MAG TPA: hypothetical protein DCP91_02315 [Eggerthellaceae bacterium]|nr:hypothetical protein [Eggerthellaceae bacterium]
MNAIPLAKGHIVDPANQGNGSQRTAAQAGWHVSRYNLSAPVPGKNYTAIANLYKGTCAEYSPIELYLMGVLDEISEDHPIIPRLSKRGVIANFDERAALDTIGRGACAGHRGTSLTICPTMGCNFDCPYCFEDHRAGKMSADVQDDVVALAERMMEANGSGNLVVTWFGGEPLLGPDVIESLSKRLMALAEEHSGKYDAGIITNGYLLTSENVRMLDECKVSSAQVTIDGMREVHDATRHLAGGGPTFDRIVENLRARLPFRVNVRHNVHAGNQDQMDELESFVNQLAEESGNDISYYPAPVSASAVADERGKQVNLLCGGTDSEVGIRQDAGRFHAGRGSYCGAQNLWCVGIDDKGNLQKCWEAVDKPEISFGTAHDWDPKDPLATAVNPDNLTSFLNTASPFPDAECRECVWLPLCAGGCPYKRLFTGRVCVPYKNDVEPYVLALHARIGEDKADADDDDRE